MKAISKGKIRSAVTAIACVTLASIVIVVINRECKYAGKTNKLVAGKIDQRKPHNSERVGSFRQAVTNIRGEVGRNLNSGSLADITKLASERCREVLNSNQNAASKEIALTTIARDYVGKVGIQHALVNIESFAGRGANQNLFMRLLFQESIDPQELLLQSARSISESDAARSALDGALRNMRTNGVNSKALETLFPLREGEKDVFDEFAGGLINYKSGDNMEFSEVTTLICKAYPGDDQARHLRNFLLDVYESRPNEVLAYCHSPDLSPEIKKEIAEKCLLLMVSRNSGDAMNQALTIYKDKSYGVSASSIGLLIREYLNIDYNAGQAWIAANASGLDQESNDAVSRSLVDYSLKRKELSEARKWLDKIVNSNDRAAAEGRIWTQERDNLRTEVKSNPTQTLQAILSGQSNYGDYWIEEAMSTWISKDFDKAQSWYQENWNKLPANKSQFLAAAFANQATGQGDTATARQWAAYIQDPKTKQRIEAGIEKTEAQSKN